jgi:hypothetical protein
MNFEEQLSDERARRVRNLSNVRALYSSARPETLQKVGGQALIVLCYAHWEGYFNFCVELYVEYVNNLGRIISEINPALLACEIEPHLSSLKDKNFKIEHRPGFAREVSQVMGCRKITQNVSLLKAASNLDFNRLRICLDTLEICESKFLPYRNFIAHQLVKWRHQVAHGDEPDLGESDLLEHSHKTEKLLLVVSECFDDKLRSFSREPI